MPLRISKKNKRTDIIIILIFVALGSIYNIIVANSLFGKAIIGSTALVAPSIIYLALRSDLPWKKLIYSTLIFGGLFGFFFEFMQEFNESYVVVSRIFPKIINVVPPDNVLGHMLMTLFMLVFYEYFIHKKTTTKISPRIKYSIFLGSLFIFATLILYYVNPEILIMDYSYALFGLAAIIPLIIYAYRHPERVNELTQMIPFFFILYLITEIIAVKYNWWIYPSLTYLGSVRIYSLGFPLEELLFWMLLYAPAILSYYKIFIDVDEI